MAMAITKSNVLARNLLTASTSRLVDGSMHKVPRPLLSVIPLFSPFVSVVRILFFFMYQLLSFVPEIVNHVIYA